MKTLKIVPEESKNLFGFKNITSQFLVRGRLTGLIGSDINEYGVKNGYVAIFISKTGEPISKKARTKLPLYKWLTGKVYLEYLK